MKNLSIHQDCTGDNPSGLYIVSIGNDSIASFDFKVEATAFVRSLKDSFKKLLIEHNGSKLF
jgi:hypothetical protein